MIETVDIVDGHRDEKDVRLPEAVRFSLLPIQE